MAKSKRKAIRSLTQSKVVDIADYRSLSVGKEVQNVACVSSSKELFAGLKDLLPESVNIQAFDGRFAFEQQLKSLEWDAVVIDQRDLKDEALALCERLKRQLQMEDLVVLVLSDDASKELVRLGLEKGCDEWITRLDDLSSVTRLLDHYLGFRK